MNSQVHIKTCIKLSWTILTPFVSENDSRAQRLADALRTRGANVNVVGVEAPANPHGSRVLRRITNYYRAWINILNVRGVLVTVNAEYSLIAWLSRKLFLCNSVRAHVVDIYDHHGFIFSGILARLFNVIERSAIIAADAAIIPIEERLSQYTPPLLSSDCSKIFFISNLGFVSHAANADFDAFDQQCSSDFHDLCHRIVVIYAGTLDIGRGLPALAAAGVTYASEIEVRIYGSGPLEYDLKNRTDISPLVFGRFNMQQLADIYRDADMLCGIYELSVPNHKYCDPNKLREVFDYFIPMLTNDGTPLARQVGSMGVGCLLSSVTPDKIYEAAKYIRDNRSLLVRNIAASSKSLNIIIESNVRALDCLIGYIDSMLL